MSLKRPLHLFIVGFFDADWGSDPDDLRRMTKYCIFLGCNVVASSSRNNILSHVLALNLNIKG